MKVIRRTLGIPSARDGFSGCRFENVRILRSEHRTGYFCPICASVSVKFSEGGVGTKRQNAKCPNCGSLERHRLFWLHFVNLVWPALPAGKKDVLHVAPEQCIAQRLRNHPEINYISGDLMMPEAMIKLDLNDIQIWDNQLDLIICSHVLEHIADDRKAMREMHRILRPGGFLLVIVPTYGTQTYEDPSITSPEERKLHFGQDDHVRKYGRDIVDRLEEAGFSVSMWPAPGAADRDILDFIACGKRIVFVGRKHG